MRLPTIVLRHRRSGEKRKINATEYAADVGRWARDWTMVSLRQGDARDAAVREAHEAWELNRHRLFDPDEQALRGDRRRAFEARSITAAATTGASPEAVSETGERWQSMPWFKARAWVMARTGIRPRNKAHAVELMNDVAGD